MQIAGKVYRDGEKSISCKWYVARRDLRRLDLWSKIHIDQGTRLLEFDMLYGTKKLSFTVVELVTTPNQ